MPFYVYVLGAQKILVEHEEKEIEQLLMSTNEFVTLPKVATAVQEFVKKRRRYWKKNENWKALKTERKFGGDDCPSVQWCTKFLARHPKLTTKETTKV